MTIMVLTKGCDHIHTQTVPHPDFFRHTVFLSVRVDDLVTTKIPPPPSYVVGWGERGRQDRRIFDIPGLWGSISVSHEKIFVSEVFVGYNKKRVDSCV